MRHIICLTIFLLNIVDLISTIILLQSPLAYEGNPVMAYFFELGLPWAIVFKIGTAAIVSYIFWRYWKQYRMARIFGKFALVMYIFVCSWNMAGMVYLNQIEKKEKKDNVSITSPPNVESSKRSIKP